MKVLITGGTRGIGRRTVEALSNNGEHSIFLGCRDMRVGLDIATQLGAAVTPVELDVTSIKSVGAAAKLMADSGVQIDALINNAGVLLERDGVDLASIVEPTLSVNLDGVIAVTEAFAPLIRDGGLIINVSSGAGTRATGKLSDASRAELERASDGLELRAAITRLAHEAAASQHAPGDTPIYALSKVGVNFYTRLVARSMMRFRCNACSPGFCRTEIAGPSADYSQRTPKEPALGADVVVKLLSGAVGAGMTGTFFKEASKPGTPLEKAQSVEEAWVA